MPGGFFQIQAVAVADGPTLTAAAAATCLPVTAKYTFAPNSLVQGSVIRIDAQGRISNVVTTPGTARLDVRLGGTIIYDTGALTLNQVVKTTLPWSFNVTLVCRAVGASGNFFGLGRFKAESIVGSPLPTVGGSGDLMVPTGVTAVGGAVDLTVANTFDLFFTQTVGTGSFTVHNLVMESGMVQSA